MKRYMVIAGVLVFALAAPAFADELEVTVDVVDEEATEEQIVRELQLPEHAAEEAHENAQQGLATANEARERGREFGEERANEARERAEARREAADERRQAAQERREAVGSGDRPGAPR